MIAPTGFDRDGHTYNINADTVAGAIALALQAEKLVYLTDVAGVLDGEAVLARVEYSRVDELVRSGKVQGGMALKLEACRRALDAGVGEVRLVPGMESGALLAAARGEPSPGTQIPSIAECHAA